MGIDQNKINQARASSDKIRSTIIKKSQEAADYIKTATQGFKNIDGELFVPTGLDGIKSEKIISILNDAYPNFEEDYGDIIYNVGNTDSDAQNIEGDYTEEEIQRVLSEWGDYCETTETTQTNKSEIQEAIKCDAPEFKAPEFLPYTNKDIIEALCCCDDDEDDILTKPVSDGNTNLGKVFDDLTEGDTDVISNSSPEVISDFADSIKSPNIVKIVSRINSEIIWVANKGNYTYNDIIIKTKDGDVVFGFKSGIIIDIKVNVGDNISLDTQLFDIEISDESDIIVNGLNDIKQQVINVNESIKRREEIPKLENDYYLKSITYAFTKGRYESYEYFYSRFTTLVTERDNLNKELILQYSNINNDSSILTLNAARQLSNDINELSVKINNIRNDVNYFTVPDSEISASVQSSTSTSTEEDGTSTSSTNISLREFKPSKESQNVLDPAWKLSKSLQESINKFSNLYGVQGLVLSDMSEFTINSYDVSIRQLKLINGDGQNGWISSTVRDERNFSAIHSGYNHTERVKYFKFIDESSTSDKSSNNWIENAKIKEIQIPENIEVFLNKTISEVSDVAAKFGQAAIYKDEVFMVPFGNSTADSFKKQYEDAESDYSIAKDKLFKLREDIKNAGNILEESVAKIEYDIKNDATYYKVFTVSTIDDVETKICYWPQFEESLNEGDVTDENINFRGNALNDKISPPITDIKWWKKFCELASIANLIPAFWPVGLVIPTPSGLIKIPLPVVWKPFVVIPTPLCLIVIGIAQAGILPCPWVFVLNPNADVPIGPVNPNIAMLLAAIRPLQTIKKKPNSIIIPAIPLVKIGENKIDINPDLTLSLPFMADDLPVYERLSLSNPLLLLFLMQWCKAGKKGQGFFENAF